MKDLPALFRPDKAALAAAKDKAIPILVGPGVKVLFCGINPGLWSGATGHHFARPGNRFWPALCAGGFTPTVISPSDEKQLLTFGCGITNFVNRTTATAAELHDDELRDGAIRLRKDVLKYKPKILAILGVGAFRVGFGQAKAKIGRQEMLIGQTHVWVLPNPSGLNAHQTPASLGKLFAELRAAADLF